MFYEYLDVSEFVWCIFLGCICTSYGCPSRSFSGSLFWSFYYLFILASARYRQPQRMFNIALINFCDVYVICSAFHCLCAFLVSNDLYIAFFHLYCKVSCLPLYVSFHDLLSRQMVHSSLD